MTETPEEILGHLETLIRVGCKRKVAEAKLRSAVEVVAEKVATLVGEARQLSRHYLVANVDPDSHMLGALPRARYLVLVHTRTADGYTRSQALSPVPKDAEDFFDWPPAGRLALTRFAEDVQNGLLFEIAEKLDQSADKLASLVAPLEQAAKALP